MKRSSLLLLFLALISLALLTVPPVSAEVKIVRSASRAATLEGTVEALAVDAEGALTLARKVERVASLEEPFIFSAAAHPDGWVVGTGNSGRVLKVDRKGKVEELFAAAEGEIFAVYSDDDGTVWAGSSPYGKVYKHRDGETFTVFDPGAAYIWDLRRDAEGRLLVATGFPGHVYQLPADDGADKGEAVVLYESPDSHVRAMAVAADGAIYAGTAGQGLIVRLQDGRRETVHDSVFPEVVSFTAADDGNVYAAVIASEASQVNLANRQAPARKDDEEKEDEAVVTVGSGENATVGSRGAGNDGARSRVLALGADGSVREAAVFKEDTVHSILYHQGGLWIATGQNGLLYRMPQPAKNKDRVLERDLEERQIAALAAGNGEAAVLTTNAAAFYRIPGGDMETGTYTSKVLDVKQVSRFGTLRWEGGLPDGSSVSFAARSGMSKVADATWTEWQEVGNGRSVSLSEVPQGRYVQWKTTFQGKTSPRLVTSELSFRQANQAPEITSMTVKAPGEILVPSSFNPQNQVYEPWSPNREGIFTSLQTEKKNGSRLKSLWKKGYRALQWEAEDANEETLEYTIELRSSDANGGGTEDWLTIVEELEEPYYNFDSTVVPDGVYRFRLTASDAPDRLAGEAMNASKVSEPVTVDHSPPEIVSARRISDNKVEIEIRDALSPLREVSYSVDTAAWEKVAAVDGLLDSRRETVTFRVPADARLVLLRLSDAAWNVVTLDVGKQLKN